LPDFVGYLFFNELMEQKMDKSRFSKTDSRRAIMALAVVAMFLATLGIGNVDAAASPVALSVDKTSATVTTDGDENYVIFTLTLDSSDSRYRKMDVYMKIDWPSGEDWDSAFYDTSGNEISNNKITITKGGSATLQYVVFCEGACESGDTNTVKVYGKTDPKFYTGSTGSNCGSSDCETDTTAASVSGNITNVIELSITAVTQFKSSLICDLVSDNGGFEVYQDELILWGYTLTNIGYNTDNYAFATTVTSSTGAETGFWTISPGLSNGKILVGTSGTGDSSVTGSISITAATDARPGTYEGALVITSNNGGAPVACDFAVVVPEPDLEIKNSDVTFSHNSAWIGTNDDSQIVKIYAKVRNNGGIVDSSGSKTNDVVVKFYIDGAQLGAPEIITSLAHGEEVTLSREWQPTRAYNDDDEVGLSVVVKVDPSDDIGESDSDNNQGTQYFKVIRAKSSTPSFFIGFFALISAMQ
jgi:hypothetical protein